MQNAEFEPLTDQLDITRFTLELIEDLRLLRAGKISVTDARARAEVAKQVLRAIGYVISAQRLLGDRARTVQAIGVEEVTQ